MSGAVQPILSYVSASGPTPPNLVIVAGQHGNPCCACCPNISVGYLNPSVGFTPIGSTSTPTVLGKPVYTFNWDSGSGQVKITLGGTLAQNFFTSLEILDSSIGDLTFTSSSATWAQALAPDGISPLTQWAWTTAKPFNNTNTYHANVT